MKAVGECVGRMPPGRSPPRGESAPPSTCTRRASRLERVVAAREQVGVRERGGVAAAGVELRQPEAVEVRLVADDHVAQLRQRPDERGGVGGEVGALGRRPRRRRGRARARPTTTSCMSARRSRRRRSEDVHEARGGSPLPALPRRRDAAASKPASRETSHLRARSAACRTSESSTSEHVPSPAAAARRSGERSSLARSSSRGADVERLVAPRGRRRSSPARSASAGERHRRCRRRARPQDHAATAAAATTAASTALPHGAEATLARPWLPSKSS